MMVLRVVLHETRWRRYWRGLFCLLLIAVAALAFMPENRAPDLTGYDKTNHLLAFGALAFAGAQATLQRRRVLAAALVGYGGFIEIVQSFLPTRHGEWADLVADSLGILAGFALVALLRYLIRRIAR